MEFKLSPDSTKKEVSDNPMDEIEVPKEILVTAWYTPQIPVNQGPGEYWGLPGLILEVHDDQNLINITFNSIENPTKNKVNYFIPNTEEKYNLDSYLDENFKLYSAYVNNQRALNATGQLNRKVTPLPYVNLEYTKEQQKLLNEYYQIEYRTFEASKAKN